ncbi:MAG TPA: DUF4867 family protein [Anaerolineaceae bacterium]|nr:DUF4867 family protein [Anaerolineaceae bacterium]
MERLEALREINPHLDIRPVADPSFAAFGRVLAGVDASREAAIAREKIRMSPDVVYDASVPALEEAGVLRTCLERDHYGQMPIQLGWCYGHNLRLDGLEYHKGNEIDVAVTDCAVMLAQFQDIHWEERAWIDSGRVRSFFIPAGTVFEFYSWGLHFAPLHISEREGFCILVALPAGTNFSLDARPEPVGEAALLFARNKWLIVHPEAQALVKDGACAGIRGENLKLKPLP